MDSPDVSKPGMTDEKLEQIIGNLLRSGVLLSAAIVLFSGIFFLVQRHADAVNYRTFHLEGGNLRTLTGIFRSAIRLRADAMIQLGLVLLIATPIARVALAALGFYFQRDSLYLGISLLVLTILLFSIVRAT